MSQLNDTLMIGIGSSASALTYVNASAFASGVASGGVAISKPASTVSGDTLLAVVWINSATAIAAPGGWTLIAGDVTGNMGLGVYIKPAGGSEPSTYTFSGATGTITGQILRFQGGVGALDAAGTFASSSSVTSTANGFTASFAGVHIAVFAIRASGRTVSVAPSGMTQVGLYNGASNTTCATYIVDPSPSGSISTKTLTWSSTATTQSGQAIQLH